MVTGKWIYLKTMCVLPWANNRQALTTVIFKSNPFWFVAMPLKHRHDMVEQGFVLILYTRWYNITENSHFCIHNATDSP